MNSIDDLLARQSESELLAMRDALVSEMQTIPLDIARIDRVLASKRAQSIPSRQSSTSGARPRIETILSQGSMPPKEISAALAVDGGPEISDSTLYNILSRMARSGELNRVRGRYAIPQEPTTPDRFRVQASANGSTPEAEGREIGLEGRAPD
jgi:hypothetical protein